jgi:DTW domain-containing protein YfiP
VDSDVARPGAATRVLVPDESALTLPASSGAQTGRPVCERCRRPIPVCYCAHIHQLTTRTRVVLLQHPRERHVAVGTARMAHLALPNSTLRLGLDFSLDPVVTAELAASPDVYVLFPGPNARDAATLPRDRPVTLVVLDGTWWQARKLWKLNPVLAALPQVAFAPRQASAYRIRRQPAAFCLSTIEALAEVLPLVEPAGQAFERLLDPFHAMVARQEHFAAEIAAGRHRRVRVGRAAASAGAEPAEDRNATAALAAAWPRLVCVHGEANAWPKRQRDRPDPEIVHWVAARPATGEVFEAVIAPRCPLGPATPARLGLDEATLRAGRSVDAWREGWRAFCAPDDIVVTWGRFHMDLAAADDLGFPPGGIDLRRQAPWHWRRRVRTIEDAEAALIDAGATVLPAGAEIDTGRRGGVRLATLVRVLTAMTASQRGVARPAQNQPRSSPAVV